MGHQQLLLVTLSVVLVGGLTIVGLASFESSQIQQDREEAILEAIAVTSEVQRWKMIPAHSGGGLEYTGFYGINFNDIGYEFSPLSPNTFQTGSACLRLTASRPDYDAQLDVRVGGCGGEKVLSVTIAGTAPDDVKWQFN